MTRRQTLGLLALCLWSSAAWLTNDLIPSGITPVAGQGLRFLLIGLASLLIFLFRRTRPGGVPISRLALFGGLSLGLLGLPSLFLIAAQGRIPSTTEVLVFAMMPVVLAVNGASSDAELDHLRLLPYGLLGVAGTLVLLPVQLQSGGNAILGTGLLLLAMISTTVSLVWMHRLLRGIPLRVALPVAGLANGVLLIVVAGTMENGRWGFREVAMDGLRCVLIDLPEMVLLIWLVKTISPQRLSVRYLLAPLLTVIEGLILVRPHFDVRTLIGIALLGFGAYRILGFDGMGKQATLKLQ